MSRIVIVTPFEAMGAETTLSFGEAREKIARALADRGISAYGSDALWADVDAVLTALQEGPDNG